MELTGTLHTGGEYSNAVFNVVLRSGYQLGGRGRSRGAKVSDKVRNSEVSLVTDGGDDRKLRGCNRAGKPFVVEAGEIFQRPATTGKDDEIHEGPVRIEPANAGSHRDRTGRALHRRGIDKQVEPRVSPSHDGDNIANDRAGGRGNDPYALREGWQWTFSCRIEESFSKQASLELFKGKLK